MNWAMIEPGRKSDILVRALGNDISARSRVKGLTNKGNLHTVRTFEKSRHDGYGAVFCACLSLDDVEKIDDWLSSCNNNVRLIALEWVPRELNTWKERWQVPLCDIKTKKIIKQPKVECLLTDIQKVALKNLRAHCIGHHNDKEHTLGIIRAIKKYAFPINTQAVYDYMLKDLGRPTEEADFVITKLEAKSFKGGAGENLRYLYKRWQEMLADGSD